MKKLFESWRGFLNEGKKKPSDLPDGVEVRIHDIGDQTIAFQLVDAETGDQTNKDWAKMRDKFGLLYGSVYIRPYGKDGKGFDCMGAFEVASSGASSGWGPMLYDLAMEYATKNGGGLVSDRTGVSEDAYFVWKKYMDSRDDVEKIQLDDYNNTLTPEDEDNCAQLSAMKWAEKAGGEWHHKPLSMLYRKNNTETFDELKNSGKLFGRSSLDEVIEKSGDEYCLKSKKKNPKTGKRKNLGCYPTKAGAEKREKQVQYFKHKGS